MGDFNAQRNARQFISTNLLNISIKFLSRALAFCVSHRQMDMKNCSQFQLTLIN